MRKPIAMALVICAGLAAFAQPAKDAGVRVYVDGRAKKLDPPAMIRDGKTYLGLRGVATALGATTKWDNKSKVAIVTLGNKRAKIAQSEGIMVNSVLFLPLRTTGEALGCAVQWDGRARAVRISKEAPPPNCYG